MIQASKIVLLIFTAISSCFNLAFGLIFGICAIMFVLLFVPPPKDENDDNIPPSSTGGYPAPPH